MVETIEILISSFLVSFILSTWLIRSGIPRLLQEKQVIPYTEQDEPGSNDSNFFDYKTIGFWIGFFETLLVFAFVYEAQYGALAIIIGAKEFVRKEKIEENPSYYLLGTLINVSVAVVFALIARLSIQQSI